VSRRKPRTYENCSPGKALEDARRLVTPEGRERHLYEFTSKFSLRLHEVGLDVFDQDAIHLAVQHLVLEARAEDFQPMAEPYEKDPGYGFEFESQYLGGLRVYFKVRLIGSRPRVEVCSLHRPDRFVRHAGRG